MTDKQRLRVLGRAYLCWGTDRYAQPFAEVGVAERVVVFLDGSKHPICNGRSPSLTLTWGAWPAFAFYYMHPLLDVAVARLWVTVQVPS